MTTTIDRMLSTREVAVMFGVNPKTVTNWAKAGKFKVIRTPGGHRRFRESEILALLAPEQQDGAE